MAAAGRNELESLNLAPWASRRRQDLLDLVDQLTPKIQESTRALEEEAENRPVARRLMTHPGVGVLTALAFDLVIGTPLRTRAPLQFELPSAEPQTLHAKSSVVWKDASAIGFLSLVPIWGWDSGQVEVLGVLQLNVCAKCLVKHFTGFCVSTRAIGHRLFDADDLMALRALAEAMTRAIHFLSWAKPCRSILAFSYSQFHTLDGLATMKTTATTTTTC